MAVGFGGITYAPSVTSLYYGVEMAERFLSQKGLILSLVPMYTHLLM